MANVFLMSQGFLLENPLIEGGNHMSCWLETKSWPEAKEAIEASPANAQAIIDGEKELGICVTDEIIKK